MRRVGVLLTTLFMVPSAPASSVFVTAAAASGQGYSFRQGQQCLVITANHVIAAGKRAEIVSVKGERALSTLIGRNEQLDLAVLQVLPEGSRPLPQLCSGVGAIPLDIPEWLNQKSSRSQISFQRVAARAGAVDHVPVQLDRTKANSPWMFVHPDKIGEIAQGDSGSTLWMDSAVLRSDVESRGDLIGMAIATEGGAVRVLRSDFLQQAVFAILWPIDMSKVHLAIGEHTLQHWAYGTAPRVLGPHQLNSLSWTLPAPSIHFILDLGDRDTTVEGVSVSRGLVNTVFKSLVKAPRTAAQRLILSVETSAQRPDEAGRWDVQRCQRQDVFGSLNPCQFAAARVIRGMVIQLSGDITNIDTIGLYLAQ